MSRPLLKLGGDSGDILSDVLCLPEVSEAETVISGAEGGVGARMRAGRRASNRRARHLPMRYETGLPSSVIRFRT